MLPRVAVFFTGGTIDSVGADRLDLAWYIEAGKRLQKGEFLERIPEIQTIAHVEETSFRRLSSHALVDQDWLDLLRTVQDTPTRVREVRFVLYDEAAYRTFQDVARAAGVMS